MEAKEVIIYGSGKRGKRLIDILKHSEYDIKYFIDSSEEKIGQHILKYRIQSPDVLFDIGNEKICIAIANNEERNKVRINLLEVYGINEQNIISCYELMLAAYKTNKLFNQKIKNNVCKSDSPRKIVLDCSIGLGLGGIEEWSKDICKAFWNEGIGETYIISDNGNYDIEEVLEERIEKVELDRNFQFSQQNIMFCIDGIMRHLPCYVLTSQPDCVLLSAYLIKQHYPDLIKVISVIHGGRDAIYQSYMALSECTDFYVGVGKDIEGDMINLGVSPDKITSMSSPFACEKNLERTYTLDNSEPIKIGYAGRIVYEQKRMDYLVKVLEILESKGVNYILEMAGGGTYEEKINEFIGKNNLENRINKLGIIPRTEIPAFWKRQDVCINMADYEGNCIMKLEAMAGGAVPVVTRTAGVTADITDGENGYIVELGDCNMAAQKIEYLSKNREQLPRMGEGAHRAVYPKSSMENHILLWKNVFNRV